MPFIYDIKRLLLGPLPSPRLVDNLPPEILAGVFSNIVTSHSYHYTEEVAALLEEEALVFRRASQVSRFWRDVALHQCKGIWGSIINIDTSSAAWVEELIRRSKNSPLTIQSLPSRRDPDEDFRGDKWTSVLAQMGRVKVLHFTLGCHEDASQLMYATSNLQAPLLESFRIGYECLCAWEPGQSLFSFNARLFDNHCPNLRDFVLTRVPFTQPTMIFSDIRLAHLDINPDLFSAGPTVSQWLDVLETQPSLRYLTMVVPSMSGADGYPMVLREVCLPNLEELSIETTGIEGVDIFASLVLPSHCGIAIQIMEENEEFNPFARLIEILGEGIRGCVKRWSGKGSGSAKKLAIESWGLEVGEKYFAFRLGSDDDEWYNPRIQVHYCCLDGDAGEEEEVLSVLPSFLDMIQRRGIVDAARSCTLDIQSCLTALVGPVDLLSRCTRNVTHLRLMGHSLWFVCGLSRRPDPVAGTALFPALHHITFEGPYIDDSEFEHAFGHFESFLHSMSASGRGFRGIPTTMLHIDMKYEVHVRFAENAKSSFGSRIETYVPHRAFEELGEPRYWIGDDELRVLARL